MVTCYSRRSSCPSRRLKKKWIIASLSGMFSLSGMDLIGSACPGLWGLWLWNEIIPKIIYPEVSGGEPSRAQWASWVHRSTGVALLSLARGFVMSQQGHSVRARGLLSRSPVLRPPVGKGPCFSGVCDVCRSFSRTARWTEWKGMRAGPAGHLWMRTAGLHGPALSLSLSPRWLPVSPWIPA